MSVPSRIFFFGSCILPDPVALYSVQGHVLPLRTTLSVTVTGGGRSSGRPGGWEKPAQVCGQSEPAGRSLSSSGDASHYPEVQDTSGFRAHRGESGRQPHFPQSGLVLEARHWPRGKRNGTEGSGQC